MRQNRGKSKGSSKKTEKASKIAGEVSGTAGEAGKIVGEVSRAGSEAGKAAREGGKTTAAEGKAVSEGENRFALCAAWVSIFVACMAVMLVFAAQKSIVIADTSRDPSNLPMDAARPGADAARRTLTLFEDRGEESALRIPLPKGARADQVTVENRYMDRELLVYIQGVEVGFFEENHVSGDISPVLSAQCESQGNGILLKLHMNRVLEYKNTMDSSGLTINWHDPGEIYDYIVVLDPAGGGSETGIAAYGLLEKELVLQVARQIQKQALFQNIRLYCTRAEDVELSAGERQRFVEESGADLYIRLCAAADAADAEAYGVTGFYNDAYYIPDFGNVQWADILTREVTIAVGNRAVALQAAGEESILRKLKIPAAEIAVGFLSNPKEEYLLGQDAYREKLAAGFVSAIQKAVEALEAKEAEWSKMISSQER